MYKLTIILAFILMPSINLFSQVTYNHDSSVMNQFTVGEVGGGSLTPDWYYDLCHRNYRNSAMTTNKQVFRTQMQLVLNKEEPYSEAIDSALTERMRVEMGNIADRTPGVTDVAYQTEKGKIERKMELYKKNIERITLEGGTPQDYRHWLERYNAISCGLQAVRDAYMPMGKRKEQYLKIYQDLLQQNREITEYIMFLRGLKRVETFNNSRAFIPKTDIGTAARSAHGRWKVAMASASGFGAKQ